MVIKLIFPNGFVKFEGYYNEMCLGLAIKRINKYDKHTVYNNIEQNVNVTIKRTHSSNTISR